MRAHWIPNLTKEESYVLAGNSLHHLVNVVRIKEGEELLLLNGEGLGVETVVKSISKKQLGLTYKKHFEKSRPYSFDLVLGMPKKEALELCLKEATELGFRNIFLVRSEFSQVRMPEAERIQKMTTSALEQSNAPFLPKVLETNWEDLVWENYQDAILLDSQTKIQSIRKSNAVAAPRLLIVGPEGGFSSKELMFLHSQDKVRVVNLPTPILRTPTALATGAGIMIESLL